MRQTLTPSLWMSSHGGIVGFGVDRGTPSAANEKMNVPVIIRKSFWAALPHRRRQGRYPEGVRPESESPKRLR
jgi:hypothetical protein